MFSKTDDFFQKLAIRPNSIGAELVSLHEVVDGFFDVFFCIFYGENGILAYFAYFMVKR
jgi:hypothetical protein